MKDKLLLSCDNYLYKCNGRYYAGRNDEADLLSRYLGVFGELRIAARTKSVERVEDGFCEIDSSRIEVVEIPFFQGPKQFVTNFFKIKRSLKSVAEGCSAAIFRLPSIPAFMVWQAVKKKLPYGVEVVYDSYDDYISSKGVHKLIWGLIDKYQRKACYGAQGVSCVTQYYLQKRYFSKVPGNFSTYYSSLSISKDVYGAVKEYEDKSVYTIAHVANQIQFEGRKGVREVIEAVAAINSKGGKQVRVKFAGKFYSDSDEAQFQNLTTSLNCGDCVEFVGTLSRAGIFDYLKSSDIFVFPTKAEGLPRVMIEAMAAGLPCVATNVSGIPELIEPRWLVEYMNVDMICEKVEGLINSAQNYNRASEFNFAKSQEYENSILQQRRDAFYTQLKSK